MAEQNVSLPLPARKKHRAEQIEAAYTLQRVSAEWYVDVVELAFLLLQAAFS